MSSAEKMLQLADRLAADAETMPSRELAALENASSEVGRAWSGSWLGYHSRVYYQDLQPVPPGARFSIEWGLMELYANEGTIGCWAEYDFKALKAEIKHRAGVVDTAA